MSTACMSNACSISWRMAFVHGSAPKIPVASERLARVDALPAEFVQDGQEIGRRHHDDARLEVLDKRHLAFGHASGHRHHGAAHLFSAVMRAPRPPVKRP